MNTLPSYDLAYDEYYTRLEDRLKSCASTTRRVMQIREIAASANDHFVRAATARRRLIRARASGDLSSAQFERRVLLALLYEIMDTFFIVVYLLDFEAFDLEPSADGEGLSGTAAATFVSILSMLEQQSRKLLALEVELELSANFKEPVDEKEGITYLRHRHWQDFHGISVEESFIHYFSRAKQSVTAWLADRPHLWAGQSVEEYLKKKGYSHLLRVLHRLRNSSLS